MFYISKDLVLDNKVVEEFIDKFKLEKLPRLERLNNYYNADNDIKNRTFTDTTKPNNKIAHSYGDYIVDTNTAIFLGNPISYSCDDDIEEFKDLLVLNDEHDKNIDIAIDAGVFGYGIQLLYLDEEAQVKFSSISPLKTILLFSDEIEKQLLYAIRFSYTKDDKLKYTVYSSLEKWGNDTAAETHNFSSIPVVVYANNSRYRGDFEKQIPLIDAIDKMQSDTLNEQDYFNDSYLYLSADNIDVEDILSMKENRVIYGEGIDPKFVLKEGGGTELEAKKSRIVSDIHKLSKTPDLSDDNFANNVSGEAMKYKLMGTMANIGTKQRKFTKGLNERNRLIYSILKIKSTAETMPQIKATFTPNIPKNLVEVADIIGKLRGTISQETLIDLLPFIEDGAAEMEKIKEETAINSQYLNMNSAGHEVE